LTTHGLLGESFAVEHGTEHGLGPRFSTMDFQWMVKSVLTTCLISGDNSTLTTLRLPFTGLHHPFLVFSTPYIHSWNN
jgi:hypothetical protein